MNELADRQIRTDLQMQAVARDKYIHLLFSEEDSQTKALRPAYTCNFLMQPADALSFSMLLADIAFEADTGLKAAGPALKAEMVERHRATLRKRIEVMLNGQREKKRVSNAELSRQLVDTVLAAVFN